MKQWLKDSLVRAFGEMLDNGTECCVFSVVSVEENLRCDYRLSINLLNELPLLQEFYPGCVCSSPDQEKK